MKLLTVRDISERLTIGYDEACRLVREGHIPHVDIPGRRNWRIRPEDLEAFISGSVTGSKVESELPEVAPNKRRLKATKNNLISVKGLWMQRFGVK